MVTVLDPFVHPSVLGVRVESPKSARQARGGASLLINMLFWEPRDDVERH